MNAPKKFSRTTPRPVSKNNDDDNVIMEDLQSLIDSAEAFLKSTASYGGAEIETARSRVASELDTARRHARKQGLSGIYHHAADITRTSGRYVSDHKWQSATALAVAAALAGGLYAGLKWSARRGSRRV